ncbi:hypothetical protein [Paenibacillus donghaensis]|uniref:hypothetical protein n=1 Tax=Paenibacillus donghaensis TaxID=414771 RepID=UPI0012F82EA2|nr:hypothetical protein [Paenibacillus donghaensis]
MSEEKRKPCTRCGFDDEFITDYLENGTEIGKEHVFCGNCGTPAKEGEKTDAQRR